MPLGVFGMYFGCRAKSTAEKKNAATKIQDHDGFACVGRERLANLLLRGPSVVAVAARPTLGLSRAGFSL